MKNSKTTVLALLACIMTALTCCGCLKADLMLEIGKDGSGSLEASYTITENSIAQLNSMVNLSHQLNKIGLGTSEKPAADPEILLFLDPDENRIRSNLAKYEKHGLKIDKLRVRSRNSQRSVDLRLNFDNIAEVAKADFFADNGFSLYRRKSGDMLFHRKSMNADNPDKDALLDPEAQKMVAPILGGFMVTVKVLTPGRVLETNADSSGLKSATWIFDQDRDAKAFQRLQNQTYMILIEGADITIPDIRIVTQAPAK